MSPLQRVEPSWHIREDSGPERDAQGVEKKHRRVGRVRAREWVHNNL